MFREDISCNVLLASLGSAAVGLDLTAACQVHLIEPSWNPMLERQALDRVHRLGQENPVHTFRYMVDKNGSIEKHICEVQARKMEMIMSSFGDGDHSTAQLTRTVLDFADTLREVPR